MKLSHCSWDTSNSETPGQMEMIYIREIRECMYNGHTFTHSIIALLHYLYISTTSHLLHIIYITQCGDGRPLQKGKQIVSSELK